MATTTETMAIRAEIRGADMARKIRWATGVLACLSNLAQVYRFRLLEDFDHLYRYAALLDRLEGKDAQTRPSGSAHQAARPHDHRRRASRL
jgi:hypothetical protein